MTYRYRFFVLLAAFLLSVSAHWGLLSFLSKFSMSPEKAFEHMAQVRFDIETEQKQGLPATETSMTANRPVTPFSDSTTSSHSPVSNLAQPSPTQHPGNIDMEAMPPASTTIAPLSQNEQSLSGSALAAGAIAMVRSSGTQAGLPLSEKGETPRKQLINQTTRDIRYRQYAEDWRQKIERVGKVAFPESSDPNASLQGRVLVRVIIQSDGSIAQLGIVRSSKNAVLDNAALNIVRLAAPFSPFPENFKNEVDLIEITRWWSFEEVFR